MVEPPKKRSEKLFIGVSRGSRDIVACGVDLVLTVFDWRARASAEMADSSHANTSGSNSMGFLECAKKVSMREIADCRNLT